MKRNDGGTAWGRVVLGTVLLLQGSNVAFAADAHAVFARLGGLAGDWEGTFSNGRHHTVNYRFSAGGTALVETWALAPGRESLTIYTLDGDALVATHYCPQGTQPRLKYSGERDGRLQFELLDGGSLQVPGRSHQHAFWLQWNGGDALVRSETYVENGAAKADAKPEAEVVEYRRLAAAKPAQ